MKKLSLLIILAGFAYGAKAQNAEVVNAYNYQKFKEYDKAKISIDKAILDPKTGISAKTWYYRGLIYQDIEESPDAATKAVDAQSLDKAMESYLKALELDVKKAYSEDIKKRIPYLQNRYLINGGTAYKEKNFQAAADLFMKAVDISEKVYNKIDTGIIFNAALSALNARNVSMQKTLFTRLVDLKYPEVEVYRSLSAIYLAEKDTTKGLEYIALGKAAFPSNNALMIDELNVYMARGQSKQMISKMEEAANADPKNKTLWFALGATYDNMGKKENAETAYKKALDLDSVYFDALYNLGAMHYNAGVEVYNKVKDLPMSKEKEYNAGKAKYTAMFNKSLPYLEKALELQPNDINTLASLKEIYAKLDKLTKSTEMRKRIEELNKVKVPAKK
jgi:tetratricopeptide (TPR) repeat protein